ncbi:EG45-like domain containing protein [Salvia miltiorrhiza]|uniref:EG45-like domain containing protein n=1 Tax=Salvia miltiorrhiza TaxID=226208 RepID=UPI0025AB99A5|nr:EG45-like domain containing protein [Salvia miltiorrhiza]
MAIARIVIVLTMASSLIFMVAAKSGKATFYTDYSQSACYESKQEGTMIAAANPRLYDNGKACGHRYKIRCTGGTNHGDKPCRSGHVTVKIVDLCPDCAHDQLDLSKQAFRKIGNLDAGVIRINYVRV